MDVCIKSSAGGLGLPIQMWEITNAGSRQIPPNELKAVADTVKLWETEEQSLLAKIAGVGVADAEPQSGVEDGATGGEVNH